MPARTKPDETILIVEDDLSIRIGLELNLKAEGYRVLSAELAQGGLELARAERPELIVLDLMLPDGSGLDLLQTLRREGLEMKVLILTALGLDRDKVRGLRLGADDYITKPFGVAELLARIDAALRRGRLERQRREPSVRFGEVSITPQRREVRRGQQELKLTSKEYDLLLHLAGHPERVFSREQLLQAVWGPDYEGTTRTVDTFIYSLRNKIEADPGKPRHLLTVHGVGYRLNP
jgi:DNA-binding response OmpR family regulator